MKQPYKYWTKIQLFDHLRVQCFVYGYNVELLEEAIESNAWNPVKDYNGCNVVQDDLHPFYPCFIHDWRWITFDYEKTWDIEFKRNLLKFGYSVLKSEVYYIMVRCGWLFYYKWVKK